MKKQKQEQSVLQRKAEMLTGKDFWSTQAWEELGVRSMFLSDGPHGLRKQAAASDHLGLNESLPATCFPTASLMACTFDESLGEKLGQALGEEAASMGVDVLLGPGLNVKRNPLCGRNFEYFSEDPLLAGKMAAAYIRGIQSKGVAACAKHFAANNREYRRMTNDCIVDERTLRELYLRGFEIAVQEGKVQTVMSSYNKINGVYTNEHEQLLQVILRGEWGFDGVVVTDWGGCNDRVAGLKAGNELEMPSCRYGADDIVRAVQSGEISESLLDESISRLAQLSAFTQNKQETPFDKEAHHDLARECAENAEVLLYNDGTLPLKQGTRVAVIGDFAFTPRYQGAGSSIVNPTKLSTFAEVIDTSNLEVVAKERGFHRFGKTKKNWTKRALQGTERADVTLFFAGLDEFCEAEGLDRTDMKVPENQIALFKTLVAAGRKVVVIMHSGSSVEMGWTDGAAAVLWAGLGGQAGAEATVNVLTGKVNPSGKLAETWWEKYEDCPTADTRLFPGGEDITVYQERLAVGYRGVKENKPKYCFGHGLSYTKFEYSNLRIAENGVYFTVKNTGDVAGKETAFAFYGKADGVISRPKRQLFAFSKVELSAGEEKEVFVAFTNRTFAYYDMDKKAWQTEAGAYQIEIGASAEDIRLVGEIQQTGETLESEPKVSLEIVEEPTKKRGMLIHENSTVNDLRYAKGWVGRAFLGVMRFAIGFCKVFGKKEQANTLIMGVIHQPVRGLAKFGGMRRKTMEGLLLMFNGKFFKGLKTLLGGEK